MANQKNKVVMIEEREGMVVIRIAMSNGKKGKAHKYRTIAKYEFEDSVFLSDFVKTLREASRRCFKKKK